mgnify:CR=1 FL=1
MVTKERALEVKEKYTKLLMDIPGVAGTGVGGPYDNYCMRVYTENGATTDLLKELLKEQIEGVRVEFVDPRSILGPLRGVCTSKMEVFRPESSQRSSSAACNC